MYVHARAKCKADITTNRECCSEGRTARSCSSEGLQGPSQAKNFFSQGLFVLQLLRLHNNKELETTVMKIDVTNLPVMLLRSKTMLRNLTYTVTYKPAKNPELGNAKSNDGDPGKHWQQYNREGTNFIPQSEVWQQQRCHPQKRHQPGRGPAICRRQTCRPFSDRLSWGRTSCLGSGRPSYPIMLARTPGSQCDCELTRAGKMPTEIIAITLQQSWTFIHRPSGKRTPRRPSRHTTTQNRRAEIDSQVPHP
ncbi:uncharacterized protein [Heptranchias perlo]|uniref:uncharacterized protein n=1 Tax=Heptranchias perlo TaxID=212740 RepID=UPI00355A0222